MELSKFTANCTKSAQFTDPCPELHEICALHAHFSRFCIPSGKIVKIHAIHIILSLFCKFCTIHIDGKNPGYSKFSKIRLVFINLQYHFLTLVRQDPAPCLSESRKFHNLKLQFAKYQLCMNFQLLCIH